MKAIAYTRTAIKSLKAMPKKDREAVMDKMADYAAGGQQDVKRLQGSDLFRLCHGNWRAVFSQDGTVLAVLNVAKWGEVYR